MVPTKSVSVPDAVAKILAEEFGFSVNGVVKDAYKAYRTGKLGAKPELGSIF